MKSIDVGQTYKSKQADPVLGHSTIIVKEILTSDVATVSLKWDNWDKAPVERTLRVDTIKKDYHPL